MVEVTGLAPALLLYPKQAARYLALTPEKFMVRDSGFAPLISCFQGTRPAI